MTSKEYFQDVATEWDSMRQSFFSESVRDVALEVAGVHEGQTAADIGAGTGFVSEALIREGLNVIAVDQSPAMLDEIRSKLANGHLDCRVGDAENLPLANGEVDSAFANMYLHHVEHPEVAIREMTRILKPGGRLVITDLDQHEFEWLRREHHDRWMGFDREDVSRWFKEAGLQDVVVNCAGEE